MSKHRDLDPDDAYGTGTRVSVGGARRVSLLTPSLRLGLATLVVGIIFWGSPAGPGRGLPRHARLIIETDVGIITGLAFAPDGTRLVSGDYLTGGIATWDAASGRPLASFRSRKATRHVRSLALAPDGRSLAVGLLGQDIAVVDPDAGELTLRLPDTLSLVAPGYTPDGRRLIAAGTDRTIRVFDMVTLREQRSWAIPGSEVRCLAVAPDGQTLATGDSDGRLRCWDLDSGELRKTVPAADASIDSVAYSPDGRTLISRADGRLRLWDTRTFQARRLRHAGDLSPILSQGLSPDGRFLATGHCDHVIRLWDPATGTLLRSLSGHRQAVHSLAFTPDARTLASGAGDGTILLWDLAGLRPALGEAGVQQ